MHCLFEFYFQLAIVPFPLDSVIGRMWMTVAAMILTGHFMTGVHQVTIQAPVEITLRGTGQVSGHNNK